ncbi:hypothetical protein BJP34_25070 [Moorena producens PAL-8-15-08-1]|uniref:Uncharacterized protein n=2 Tax=Moorena TaxID=1155738 RepID=A0A1D8TXC2_9CYAN|nr:hypothetical protein BJP34_25070 [Moorena producens PAL-8-15-08-1]
MRRLGRVLRKGKHGEKVALLYEVIAEDTSEEETSWRRHGGGVANQGRRRKQPEGAETGKQVEFLPGVISSTIGVAPRRLIPRGSFH